MAGKNRTWLPGGVLVETWINPFGLVPTLVARVVFPEIGGEEELEETSKPVFIYYPISTEAPYGWGTPFAVDGTPINPPLGTILTFFAQNNMSFLQYRLADDQGKWAVSHGKEVLGGRKWKKIQYIVISWEGPLGWQSLAPSGKNSGYAIFFGGTVLTTYTRKIFAVSIITRDNINYIYALAEALAGGGQITIIRRIVNWDAKDVVGDWQVSAPVSMPDALMPFQADINASCNEAVAITSKPITGTSDFLWNWWDSSWRWW
jgi:hypothetical protein